MEEERLVFNKVNANVLKAYLCARISEIVDEMVDRRHTQKKKAAARRVELRIPVDLLHPEFVRAFSLDAYRDGVLASLVSSIVENNFFSSEDGKLEDGAESVLILTPLETRILSCVPRESSLYVDVADVKALAGRLKNPPTELECGGVRYSLDARHVDDFINTALRDGLIALDEKSSLKDSMYCLDEELLCAMRRRFMRSPQISQGLISRSRLHDYLVRAMTREEHKIYVGLRDPEAAEVLGLETVCLGDFTYVKYTSLVSALSASIDRCSKRMHEDVYARLAHVVPENTRMNVSKLVDALTVQTTRMEASVQGLSPSSACDECAELSAP
ncbi:putative DNA-binding virion protein [Parapoxvirus red deer/HL953]|uniref:Putative DNA-binding virion protein n=1 Tax=Parapoxvirus red deer/HL953 TaxID=1579460 RepID=A0A0A7MEQ9_9POXV|nr:putative DNA-binding virion protein [Parapoxvirus red deer/HL953]AIZ77281.1 putative DNA-binding virion protein [Parapoxvirus red deer/HL953]